MHKSIQMKEDRDAKSRGTEEVNPRYKGFYPPPTCPQHFRQGSRASRKKVTPLTMQR